MPFGLYVFKNFNDHTLRINEEGGAVNAVVLLPHEFLGTPYTVGQANLMIFIRQQGEREVIFFLELFVLFR